MRILLLLGSILFASWRYAQRAGLLKDEVTTEIRSATERRIVFYQALYAIAVLLSVVNTYISIVLLILMQLNSAIAPRLGQIDRFLSILNLSLDPREQSLNDILANPVKH